MINQRMELKHQFIKDISTKKVYKPKLVESRSVKSPRERSTPLRQAMTHQSLLKLWVKNSSFQRLVSPSWLIKMKWKWSSSMDKRGALLPRIVIWYNNMIWKTSMKCLCQMKISLNISARISILIMEMMSHMFLRLLASLEISGEREISSSCQQIQMEILFLNASTTETFRSTSIKASWRWQTMTSLQSAKSSSQKNSSLN